MLTLAPEALGEVPEGHQDGLTLRAAVAIAMAVYRPHPRYLREQLESILAQTMTDWVCVMTWDSPIEDLDAELARTGVRADSRFVWIQNEQRLGHKKNFEQAIRLSAALDVRAIACADQDDRWHPDKLGILLRVLDEMPALGMVHSDMAIVYSRPESEQDSVGPLTAWTLEKRLPENADPACMLLRNHVTGCSLLMDVELARRFPAIPDAFDFHDHWFATVAACHGGIRPIRTALLLHRQHPHNVFGVRERESPIQVWRKLGSVAAMHAMVSDHAGYLARLRELRVRGLPCGVPKGLVSERWGRLGTFVYMVMVALRWARNDPLVARHSIKVAVGALCTRPGSSRVRRAP